MTWAATVGYAGKDYHSIMRETRTGKNKIKYGIETIYNPNSHKRF